MTIEKINDKVFVVQKELFNETIHHEYYAIDNYDTELIEYLFDQYHYPYCTLELLIIYCMKSNNLTMIKRIVNFVMNTYSNDDDIYHINGMSDMIDNLLKEAENYRCSKEIIDYLKQYDYS